MCGATFNDMDVPNELQSVCVLMHKCYDPIENNITAVASLKSFVSTVPGLYQRQLILKIIIQCPECTQPQIDVQRGHK